MLNFYIASFIVALALNAAILATPLFLIDKFNVSPLFLGAVGTAGSIFYMVAVVIAGRLADKFEKKFLISLGCICFSITYLIVPHVKHESQILYLVPIGSMSLAFFWPSIQSWLSYGLNKEALTRVLGIYNISWSIGLLLGPLTGGILFEKAMWLPFVFSSLAILVAVLILSRQPTIRALKERNINEIYEASEDECLKERNLYRFLYIGWIANFSSWFCMGIIRYLFPKLTTDLGITAAQLGVIMIGVGLSQLIMFIILGRTHRWHYKVLPIVGFQILCIAGLFIITLFSHLSAFALAIFIMGLSFGMTYYASIFYSLWGQKDKGKKSGLHEGIIGAGALIGPLLGGIVADMFSLRAPYVLAAIMIVVVIGAEIWIAKKK